MKKETISGGVHFRERAHIRLTNNTLKKRTANFETPK
jgi:hypothetical protein